MKEHSSGRNSQNAFTLTELLVVIATVALMAALALPALAHAKTKSPAAGCISKLRQMMVGWEMYKEDNNNNLMPNAAAGQAIGSSWVGGYEDWHTAAGNTNLSYYTNALLAPYVGNDVRVFKCPADVVPSDNGQRLRSRSMNGQMGPSLFNYNTGWRVYTKGSDLTCPTPANAWVWCDESPFSINDGYLQVDLLGPDYPDVPANYHGKACGFSFADGHAEEHRWNSSTIASVPVIYGAQNNGAHLATPIQDTDYIWLRQHTACKLP